MKYAKEEGLAEAVKKFASDPLKLVASTFVLGVTKALDEVAPLLSEEQKSKLQEHENYNLMGWQIGRYDGREDSVGPGFG